MISPTKKIEKLIPFIIKKDIPLAYRFLKERNFESLKELIDSTLYKVRKNLKKETPNEEYLTLDIEMIETLKAEVDLYSIQLGLIEEDLEDSIYDEFKIENALITIKNE